MKIFFFIVMLAICHCGYSQFIEKVYLKDSVTVYKGWIIEQVPQEYLKILRLEQRDTVTLNVGDVWKIVREIDIKKINSLFKNPIPERKGVAQSLFLELLGNGGIYTINYDRRFKKGRRDGWGGRIGFGYLNITDITPAGNQSISTLGVPADINYLFGKRKGALELGIGTTYFRSHFRGAAYNFNFVESIGGEPYNIQSNGFIGFLNIGYRYRTANNGFMFKAGLGPIIFPQLFVPVIGISVGYHFQRK